jgi:NADH dehydrogenase [ubiquinone] 1 alpha subcomplex assembly factor 1
MVERSTTMGSKVFKYIYINLYLSFIRHDFSHNDYLVIHNFADHEEIKKWTVRTDLDEGVGESTAELVPSGHGSVLFRGQISSKMVSQNTLYNQSGFAIMFSERLRGTLLMPAHQKGWTNFTHILLRIRGDGRFYEIRFHTPDQDHHHWVS